MQRIAIIDIGSNSARLVITHLYKNGAYNMVFNQKEALRLSQKVDGNGCITEAACKETIETMRSFAHMCQIYQVNKIIAVATAAIRNAKNGPALVKDVAIATGINLHIIPGTTEAYISYLGVINTLDIKEGIIFDLGGGSTELILFKDRKIVDSVSLPLGAVNMTGMFNTRETMSPKVLGDFSVFVSSRLAQYPWLKEPKLPLIGVGGTARTIGKMIQKAKHYPSSKIHNYSFSLQSFRSLFRYLQDTSLEQRKKIAGLNSERADIILAGASIINCLLEATGSKKLVVSGCGLREGLFYDFYSKTEHVPLISEDILASSTENMLKLYGDDINHSRHVAELALKMFDGLQELHGLNRNYRRLLKTAALLHDIGITINYYSHARHTAYMILNAKLFGVTTHEQMLVAAIAGWHNGVAKSYFKNYSCKELMNDASWAIANRLALLVALAECLDYSQTGQITEIKGTIAKKKFLLTLYTKGNPNIELHQLVQNADWFKKVYGLELVPELIPVETASTTPLEKNK